MDPPTSSSSMITGGHIPLAKLGLVPSTPSRNHTVAFLDTIFFDKERKNIVRRSEKRLKINTQPYLVTVTEKTVMEHTDKDPIFMTSMNIEETQANIDNVDNLVEDAEHHKEKMLKMKDTLVKERGEGLALKRKHEETLSKFERIQKAYQALEFEEDELDLSVTIMEREKKDLHEDKVLELEA